jgi:polysaccharide chain length determinant protein (PEP-CTERM system associated)
MVRNGQLTLGDVKRVLSRFWWILPIGVVGVGLLGGVLAKVLPRQYTSETLVLVARPTVPSKVVEPIVTEDLNHRLASMQEQILSRSRLEPVIEKFGLYPADRNRLPVDNLVERLRKSITVTPMEPMRGTEDRSLPGFYVKVTFSEPRMAQQICTEITSMFMEQNVKARERQAGQTTTFLEKQLQEAKQKLDEQDARLAVFKKRYLGALPEEEQTNLSVLMGMNSQLEAVNQALSRAHQDRAFNETMLTQQLASWKGAQTGQNPESLDQQLRALQDQLTALQSRYTQEHPDVIKTKSQIEEVKRRMEANSSGGNLPMVAQGSATEPPNIQQLRAKLRQDDINIADLTKRQSQIQDQIHVLQSRVQASPVVEQQLKELTRSYQSALEFYNELQRKYENSAMAKDLEHQQQSEQFRVLDAPNLPSEPSFPKLPYFVAGGGGTGLALALGLMYLIGASDKAMHSERDVELCLKLPVLTMIPAMESHAKRKPGRDSVGKTYDLTGKPA